MQNIYYINKQNVLTENIKKAVYEMNYNVRILSKEVDLLEEKINKAIEHIKGNQYWNGDNYNCLHCEKLLEILGDKENEKD